MEFRVLGKRLVFQNSFCPEKHFRNYQGLLLKPEAVCLYRLAPAVGKDWQQRELVLFLGVLVELRMSLAPVLDSALVPVLSPAARWVSLEFLTAVWVRVPPPAAHPVSQEASTLQLDLALAPRSPPAVLPAVGWGFEFVWVLTLALALVQL
jgi:hypothetical protein